MSDERWQLISVTAAAITVPGDLPVAVILSVAVALAVSRLRGRRSAHRPRRRR